MKVLFVCLGNICRSPLAEGIMKHKLKMLGLDSKVMVDSCGTSNYHIGDLPDSRTRQNAKRNGVSLDHRGRQLSMDDLNHFDFILAMDRSNHDNILGLRNDKAVRDKIMLMRKFDTEEGEEVPDPYYGGEDDFQEVFNILNRSIDGFIIHLQSKGLI
ncbi:MAG: low molecular weight phosphotyrosine protein phosphatase [Cyclobacteriaceae bacterium]|nr:low molecular weight phosphotyrosine protein phosphatase [Cyclobacteriaceae bacterium]